MSFKKQDIYKALETITAPGEGKSLVENENITNIVTFGKEVIIDVTISNPSLQAKKRIESEIINALRLKVSQEIAVKVNVKAIFCGVLTIIAPLIGKACTIDKCTSPVPGGKSINKKSNSPQSASKIN